jgi:hypothetical protein
LIDLSSYRHEQRYLAIVSRLNPFTFPCFPKTPAAITDAYANLRNLKFTHYVLVRMYFWEGAVAPVLRVPALAVLCVPALESCSGGAVLAFKLREH